MNISLELEAVDDDIVYAQMHGCIVKRGGSQLRWKQLAMQWPRPRCQRVTGVRQDGSIALLDLRAHLDFSRSDSRGARGIFYQYNLAPGLHLVSQVKPGGVVLQYGLAVAHGTRLTMSVQQLFGAAHEQYEAAGRSADNARRA